MSASVQLPPTAAKPSFNPTTMGKSDSSDEGGRDQNFPREQVSFYGTRVWVSQAVVASFLAGGVAGAVSRTVVSPLERLKILLQVQSSGRTEYKMSIPKALGKIWREEGFKGMMAGNGTNCIRIVPYSAVQFGSYNLYKPVRVQRPSTRDADLMQWQSTSNPPPERLYRPNGGSLVVRSPGSRPSPSPTLSISFARDYPFNQHPSPT